MNIRNKANNNRKNKRGLLEFQKRQLELAMETEEETRKHRIESNLETWNAWLPEEHRIALPNKLHPKTIEKIKEASIKPPYNKFIIITSKDATTSMFTSYAIAHALLKQGLISPGEIKDTFITDAYSNIHGMFDARYWKSFFFEKTGCLLQINGLSKALTKEGRKGEEQFWRELIEHSRYNNRLVIITYIEDDEENALENFVPLLSSNKFLNNELIKKSLPIKLSNEEEEEIKNEQKRFYKSI